MQPISKNPIILIPGLMCSIGGDMIPGINAWSFGVAKWIYDPMIEALEGIGYRREQNLFICYYDWRLGSEEIVENYLLPVIERVRSKFPHQPIDIICHSMGGIVARQYIQGYHYRGNIQRLIMMGTPNSGSIDAYYLWSTGTLVPAKKKSYQKILYRGYVWVLSKILQIPLGIKNIERFHANFQGLSNLIPSTNYGNFLCVEDGNNGWVRIPRQYMKYQNSTLDKLNDEVDLLKKRVEEVHCFVGTGYDTNELLVLDREELFYQGREVIKNVLTTTTGDNTVTLESASIDGVENMIIPTTHRGIIKDCARQIIAFYGGNLEEVNNHLQEQAVEDETLHILVKGDVDFTLEMNQQFIMAYENKRVISSYDNLKQEFINSLGWVVLRNIPNGDYSLKISSATKQGVNILVMATLVEEDYSDEVSSLSNQEVITFKIQ